MERTRIFEPFYTTKSGHSTGLGLAVAQSIVMAHQGSITVESTPGHGSTFHLYFPLAPHHGDESPTELPCGSIEPPLGAGHVLYVDDDEVMTLMVERLLQRIGYRVSTFHDA